MEASPNSIVESRQELMISPTSHANPTLRCAYFLKPCINSNPEGLFNLSSLSQPSLPPTFDPKNWPLTVNFNGWRYPLKLWGEWVSKMASLHGSTWKKAGIHDAILSSTYPLHKVSDLILGVAERWCPDTNSFIFSWGEATLTLEDMMIVGYSVLGSPVFQPLETEELKGIQEKLFQARLELTRTQFKKALQSTWLKKFMDSESEIEHEAFLSLWLSRFVLPTSFDVICGCVFPIAIHLARGTRIALAPAVLATVYRDLSLLKEKILALSNNSDNDDEKLAVTIWSPFQLVMVWVWERFLKLRPKPNLIKNREPRLAQWQNLKCKTENVRLVLDSSRESFTWRPYTKTLENWDMPKFYRDKEMWVSANSDLDEELLSFIRCLRVSELVGLDCIEQYLPHRVARQFGFDQDLPGFVARSTGSRDDAWSCYARPVGEAKCYIPSRLFETDVTTRYLEWWNHSVSVQHQEKICEIIPEVSKEKVKEQKSQRSSKSLKEKKDVLVQHPEKISEITPKVLKEMKKGLKLVTSFQQSLRTLKEKKPADKPNRLGILAKGSKRKMKVKAISSFSITPKISDRTKEGDTQISSFKITPKISGRSKRGDSPISSFNTTPENVKENETADAGSTNPSYHSKSPLQILKRKICNEALHDLVNPLKQSKTLANSSKAKKEEKCKSTKTLAEINNLLVPPGFPSKHDRVEIGVPAEEDNQTIAEILKCMNKHGAIGNRQRSGGKNVAGKLESHLSTVADNEVAKTSLVATSVARALQSETIENGKDGDSKISSGQSFTYSTPPAYNEALKGLNAVTSMEKVKHGEATEDSQQGNYDNALHRFGQSQTYSSLNEGILKIWDPVTSVEKVKQQSKAAQNTQDGSSKSASSPLSQFQSHSSPSAEALKALKPAHLVEKTMLSEAAFSGENASGQLDQSKSSSFSTANNRAQKVVKAAISGEKVKLSEAAENMQDGDPENVQRQLGQSQSYASLAAGNETFKNSELQAAVLAKKVMVTKIGRLEENECGIGNAAHKMDRTNVNKGSDKYSLESSAAFMMLEDRVRRLEKMFAERKAVLCGEKHGG